mgnify:FL=1
MTPNTGTPSATHSPISSPKKLFLSALLVFAALVLFVLPQHVSDPLIKDQSPADKPSSTPSELTPSQIAEKKQYRQEAQRVLSKIVELMSKLDQIGASEWATNSLDKARQLIKEGDEQYLKAKYESSIETFAETLNILEGVFNRAEETLKVVLDEGFKNLEELLVDDAAARARLALKIAPENADALELEERSKLLPSFIQAISLAEKHVQLGEIAAAIEDYEEAMQIDSRHIPTQEKLNILKQKKRGNDFYVQMSIGLQEMEKNRFEGAQKAFRAALDIDSTRTEPQQALEQLTARRSQYNTRKALETASQLEKMEEWQKAVAVYDALISEDSSLTEPKIRRLNASVRAQLSMRADDILKDPLKLSKPVTFRQTQKLLRDMKGIEGGEKFQIQAENLEQALYLSQVPIAVTFSSDGLTNVTLYKVGEFGAFADKMVMLKPGNYQVAGSRTGFRDVQIEFTVKLNSSNMSIEVRCTETI